MPKCQPSTSFVVLATFSDATFLLFHTDGEKRLSQIFLYVLELRTQFFSFFYLTGVEAELVAYFVTIFNDQIKGGANFLSFSTTKAGVSFKTSDKPGFDWYSFLSPSSPILRMKFSDKWKKHPAVATLAVPFRKLS